MSFGVNSKQHLAQLHPDLSFVLNEVMKDDGEDFAIIDSLRNEEQQTIYFNGGASKAKWPTSYHNGSIDNRIWNPNIADAADVVPYPIEWPNKTDPPHEYARKMERFYNLAKRVLAKAETLGIELEWGGMFKSWFDGAHFQRKRHDKQT